MLNKLKSLFIIEETDKKQKKPVIKQDQSNVKSEEPVLEKRLPEFEVSDTESANLDPKFVEVLLKAIESKNAEGFDYLEFKQSLQSLTKMEMDEPTRYKSAYAMAKTMGINRDKLVNSAMDYVEILKKENAKFNEALNNQRHRQIDGKKKEIQQLNLAIVEKQKQIDQLKKDIENHKEALNKKKEQMDKAASKLNATKHSFDQAFDVVMGQILADVEKMKEFLK